MDQWMIRTAENHLMGPLTAEQVRRLIADRKLGPQDEVCKGNSHWFHLHETQEVISQLGIEPNIAETEEELSDDVTIALAEVSEPSIPALPREAAGQVDEAVLSNRLLRQVKQASRPMSAARPVTHQPEVRGEPSGFEVVSVWKFLAVLLGGIMLILLFTVLNRFRP